MQVHKLGPKYWADLWSQMSHGLQMLGGTCPGVQQGSTPLDCGNKEKNEI